MKRTILAAASALALGFSSPALAQGSDPSAAEVEAVMAQLSGMFAAEPLTEDQESRLPQATRIVSLMIPEGSLAELMGSMFDELIGPMMQIEGGASSTTVAEGIGVEPYELQLTDEQAAEAASIFDTAWAERRDREAEVFPKIMANMMGVMEPGMRKAMSELYAINFTQQELDDIEAFFTTESGASFARKSFTMSSDPRIVAATMESMPAILQSFTEMEAQMTQATADLPPVRAFADLSAAEQAQVAEITGYTTKEIKELLADRTVTLDGGSN